MGGEYMTLKALNMDLDTCNYAEVGCFFPHDPCTELADVILVYCYPGKTKTS